MGKLELKGEELMVYRKLSYWVIDTSQCFLSALHILQRLFATKARCARSNPEQSRRDSLLRKKKWLKTAVVRTK